jgi:hypothetical protein
VTDTPSIVNLRPASDVLFRPDGGRAVALTVTVQQKKAVSAEN